MARFALLLCITAAASGKRFQHLDLLLLDVLLKYALLSECVTFCSRL